MASKNAYHHGDLQQALLIAAETELRSKGIEKFSLRGVARIADVSHAAPAHHFKDVTGLLTELAVVGWRRFLQAQLQFQSRAAQEPLEQLIAAACGYMEFAHANPQLYQLLFSSSKPDKANPGFQQAGQAAYEHLGSLVTAMSGDDKNSAEATLDMQATWSMLHGLSGLLNNGFMSEVNKSAKQRKQTIRDMLMRYWTVR